MSTETSIAHQTEKHVVRPLRILVPLIKEDLKHGDEAAEHAGMPYYAAAGAKLLEAKGQINHGEFGPWVKRNFDRSLHQARKWMAYSLATSGKQKGRVQPFSSLNEFTGDIGRSRPTKKSWFDDVQGNVERARRDMERLREQELTRQQEREADQKLALRLIEIGYKVLAKELHPDKGGSRDAMARLNRIRDRLKQHV